MFQMSSTQRIITMSWMYVFLPIVWGAVVSSYTVVERTVRPGENVSLQCDCKLSSGETIVWFRNCSHENQPTLTLKWKNRDHGTFDYVENERHFSHLNMKWNDSSKLYTLLIKNITDSHLGLYYCGSEKTIVIDGDKIVQKYISRYGNLTTRISFVVGDSAAPDCGECWMLLVILCPSSALLLSLLSSLVVYLRCRRKDEDLHVAQGTPNSRDVTSIRNQDEDGLCYATLDIPLRSQRPKKKRVQPSEFSTYSAINTKRM
ncbi:uncharacterized protein LOC115540588 isoform X1 [Gadus morhua]|uniref:uncharacterized protein LOC115540588 isoform X1 n=2 Tax=Gadus morhua TaxID=8049 RepID=UPI0011B43356|nr:uncharacterized protein LOC115540588 isoform X1 [Gadus morhua]